MKTITLPVRGMNVASCASGIEKRLDAIQGVAAADASYVTQTVSVTFDERSISEETLRDLLKDCGFACGEPMMAERMLHAAATAERERGMAPSAEHAMPGHAGMEHAGMAHAPTERPPEAPPPGAVSVERPHEHVAPAQPPAAPAAPAEHPAMAHGEMAHGEMAHGEMARAEAAHDAMAHAGMAHNMSDPAMAAAMEADIRLRFWVALALTVPILLYSPLAVTLLQLRLATPFGVSPNWVMFVLATPVVWWCGWIFHSGAWRALRNRSLDMNVLVSLGVLVAYLFSAFATLFAPGVETSFDAAAMLVTFVLFGHWMEMRSRRGSSDALNALLRLAPAQANLIGPDGQPRTVPVEEVRVGDLLLLRPGEKVPVDGVVRRGRQRH